MWRGEHRYKTAPMDTPDIQPLPCTKCGSLDTVCIETISSVSWVDYHRCKTCGHVWSIERGPGEVPCEAAS
jgi:hypothetical protein